MANAAGRIKLPACSNCKKAFQFDQTILTSVSCGHCFHEWPQCVEELEGYQRFERVQIYTGGCRLDGCEYDGNLVKNSSEASPTTLLFRNIPLEELVKIASSPRRPQIVPVVEIPRSQKRDAKTSSLSASQPSGKRVKVEGVATVHTGSPVKPIAGPSRHEETEKPISAFDLPPPSQTDDSDTDDDDEVMAGLIAASQALQRMPNDDSEFYYLKEGDVPQAQDSSTESESEEDAEEPPPDPFGMPPLSQWKGSSRR